MKTKSLVALVAISFILNPLVAFADCKYDAIKIDVLNENQISYAFCNSAISYCDTPRLSTLKDLDKTLMMYRESEGFKSLGATFAITIAGVASGLAINNTTKGLEGLKIVERPVAKAMRFSEVLAAEQKALNGEKIAIEKSLPRVLKFSEAPIRYAKGWIGAAAAVGATVYFLYSLVAGNIEEHKTGTVIAQLHEGSQQFPTCLDSLQAQIAH